MRGLLLEAAAVVLAVVFLCLVACADLPSTELCYEHPTYGKVCVVIGGRKHFREDLTPEQRAEVERWIAEKDKGK